MTTDVSGKDILNNIIAFITGDSACADNLKTAMTTYLSARADQFAGIINRGISTVTGKAQEKPKLVIPEMEDAPPTNGFVLWQKSPEHDEALRARFPEAVKQDSGNWARPAKSPGSITTWRSETWKSFTEEVRAGYNKRAEEMRKAHQEKRDKYLKEHPEVQIEFEKKKSEFEAPRKVAGAPAKPHNLYQIFCAEQKKANIGIVEARARWSVIKDNKEETAVYREIQDAEIAQRVREAEEFLRKNPGAIIDWYNTHLAALKKGMKKAPSTTSSASSTSSTSSASSAAPSPSSEEATSTPVQLVKKPVATGALQDIIAKARAKAAARAAGGAAAEAVAPPTTTSSSPSSPSASAASAASAAAATSPEDEESAAAADLELLG